MFSIFRLLSFMNPFISLPAAFIADTVCTVSCAGGRQQQGRGSVNLEAWPRPATALFSGSMHVSSHLHALHGKRRLLHIELLVVQLISLRLV